MRPTGTIQRENTISQQRIKLPMSSSQTEILELSGQQRFNVLRFDGGNKRPREESLSECFPVDIVLFRDIFNPSLFLNGPTQPNESRNSKKARSAAGRRRTVQGFCLLMVPVQLVWVLLTKFVML